MSTPPDYMVVDLDNDVTGDTSGLHPNLAYYTCEEALPGWPATSNDYRRTKLVMRRIKAHGVEWSMGSPTDEADRSSSREPLHLVTLTNDYWIGIYELTQKQYSYITQNKCAWKDLADADMRPANSNSVNSLRGNPANGYAWPENGHTVDGSLAGFRTKTGIDFDLPTEAQWEYAARAGSSRERYYSGITNLDEIAWHADNSGGEPQIVGRKKPNAWGLYDTIGNIGEMCIDMIDDNAAYPDLGPVEPVGKRESSSNRATRGGRYDSLANDCRVAFRQTSTKYSGKQIYGGWRLVAPITFTW
jgi:formylglycine-generating enzyme required for sulfatase activity